MSRIGFLSRNELNVLKTIIFSSIQYRRPSVIYLGGFKIIIKPYNSRRVLVRTENMKADSDMMDIESMMFNVAEDDTTLSNIDHFGREV